MTIQLITTIQIFNGLSTDIKPISGIPEGSIFHETDTNVDYRLSKGVWYQDRNLPLSVGRYQVESGVLRRLAEETLLEIQAANRANGIIP